MYKYYLWDPNNTRYQIWELKHVQDVSFGVSKTSTPYGVPTRSSSATQVFEMQGPVAKIDITFRRYDYEEDVPNWDFMYSRDFTSKGKRYKGIDWYTASLQTTRPYRFRARWVPDSIDNETDPGLIPTKIWNVSITRINYSFDAKEPGAGEFSISMVERRA